MTSLLSVLVVPAILASGGCASWAGEPVAERPFEVVMKAPDLFEVNGKTVDLAHLAKTLKRNKVSQDIPVVIDLPPGMGMMVIKEITAQLASAGYKPVFKNPRHARSAIDDGRATKTP